MADIPYKVLLDLLLFLIFPLAGGYLAVKLKISPLIGYIIGGVFLNVLLSERLPKAFIANFSILGLVLLVFTIGLETNFSSIKKFGRFVFLGGILQIIISSFFILILSLIFKFSFLESLLFGMAFSMSSTAVIAKIIQDRGEEGTLLGGLVVGILILQDLSLIPLLIISSSFGKDLSFFLVIKNILLNSLKAGIVLIGVYYFGQIFVPYIFNKLARVSREILNLFLIVFILFSLFVFSLLGLSSLLAAFLAGVLLGQTLEHYHIFSQIRPFRDLLAVVFFVFLGLTIEPNFIIQHFFSIALFTSLVIILKFLIVLFIFIIFKFHSRTAFSLGIFLFQIGEGAFIIIYQGLANNLVSKESYLFAAATVFFTLLITPLSISKKDALYLFIKKTIKKHLPFLDQFITYRVDREIASIDVLSLKDHVVICGYGRVGRYIGRALMLSDIPFMAIDYNFQTVERAKKGGVNIIYGDPTEMDVLDFAQVDKAGILISAVAERFAQEMIILNAKKLNHKIIIFTRVHREDDQKRMRDLGVDVVVQPEFEASLSIIRRIFHWRRLPKEDIVRKIRRIKIEHGMS